MHPHGYRILRALFAAFVLSLPSVAGAMDAVLIGNGTYTNAVWSNLACSSNDVMLMDDRLKSGACSFATTTYLDRTAPQIANAVNLGVPAIPNDTWIFYYTGHGDNTAGYSGGLAGINDNGSGSDLYYPRTSRLSSPASAIRSPLRCCSMHAARAASPSWPTSSCRPRASKRCS